MSHATQPAARSFEDPTLARGATPPRPLAAPDAQALGALERWRRVAAALRQIIDDPDDTRSVLQLSIYANAGTMAGRLERWFADPDGRLLFEECRAIDSRTVDLDVLGALPAGTLGRAYADFLRARGLTPDIFDGPPPEVRDPRSAYVHQRMRQTHDLWHVVTGYDTDPASEVALQAFTFAQVQAPSTLILALAGTLRGSLEVPWLAARVVAAFRAGRRANKLGTFLWEDHWATPLAEVRRRLNVTPVSPRSAAARAAFVTRGREPSKWARASGGVAA